MQADLLPFIDWSHHPRQIIAPEDRIITAGDPTDMLFLLEEGEALAPNAALRGQHHPADAAGAGDIAYAAGALLSLLEMLSLDAYRHDVLAREECRVIGINRQEIKAMWDRDNRLAWPLSCSIAATITQRRQTRFLM
jgi:CRP-like cAMP-binding protein